MRGHIRKRESGSWAVVVELPRDPLTGKRRQKWITVRGSKRDAERVLARTINDVERNTFGTAPERYTLAEYLEDWLKAQESLVRPTTLEKYRLGVRLWQRTLGTMRLNRVNPLDIQRVLGGSQHLGPKTRHEYLRVLRSALRQAVKWGVLGTNPAEGVRSPRIPRPQVRVWNEREVAAFLEATRGNRFYALYYVALATGMRKGELLALTWDNVDLEAGVIYVRQSLAELAGDRPRIGDPKSASAHRRVPIDPSTVEVLKELRQQQEEEKRVAGAEWEEHNLVFCTHLGRPYYRGTVWWAFKRAVKRSGLPYIRFHDLRHTHATLLLRQGVHPKIVAERLGHSSIKITLDLYSHVLPDSQSEAVRAIAKVGRDTWPCSSSGAPSTPGPRP